MVLGSLSRKSKLGLTLFARHVLCALWWTPSDWKLLCLERMRILDMVHYWALGAHGKYQGKLTAISRFEAEHDLFQKILRPTVLLRPPAGADIGLMWMMESCSLRTTPLRGTDKM
jgi:hypothetical protein